MTKITTEYSCKKRINDLDEINEIVKEFKDNYPMPSKDIIYTLYQMMGMEIEYDEIPL